MSKSDQAKARGQRLAAKLRENLKRRKGQARARMQGGSDRLQADMQKPPENGKDG